MPRHLWDFALVWCAEIFSHTYNAKKQRMGLERLTGDMPDISEWLDFDMYDQIWFWDSPGKEENPRPGRWLGVSHHIGSTLCYWVIDGKGTIYSRTTVQHVTAQDMKSDDICRQFESLDASLMEWLDDENFVSAGIPDMHYEEDMEADYVDSPEPYDPSAIAGDIEEEANVYDEYLRAELYLDVGPNGGPRKGTVRKCLKGEDGVGRNTQVHHNYTTPHKTQMIDTTINLLVNRMECTNLSSTTLTLRLAVKSDNSSPAILFRDSEKLDATIKLSLTLPTHSCHCPHGRTKSCFTHNNFSKFHKLRSL